MRRLVLALALALSAPAALAQQTSEARAQRVTLADGRVVVGIVIDNGDGTVTIVEPGGVRTTVPTDRIARIDAALPGGFTRVDPAASRMFLTPTAYTIPKGQKRISTFLFVLPTFSAGLGDRVDASVYGNIPLDGEGLIGGNVKFNIARTPTMATSVGVSANTVYGGEGSPVAGTAYALTTFGNEARNITVGAYGVYGGDRGSFDVLKEAVGLSLSGSYQVSNSLKLMSENMLAIPLSGDIDGTGSLHLAGVRFFGDRISGDMALVFGQDDGDFEYSPIPYVSFSYTF